MNSILYQRGIYPPEQFERKKKYGWVVLLPNAAGPRQGLTAAAQPDDARDLGQ